MLKYTIILVNMIGVIMYKLFFAGDISVSATMPSTMKLGTETPIEITINKGTINSFAKLSLELPAAMTAEATSQDLKGASFSQSGTLVKIIWTSLPSEPSFKITVKVKAIQGATDGEKSISGKFSYVVDNVKQTSDMPAVTTTLSGSSGGTVAETPAASTPATTETASTPPAPANPEPAGTNTTPAATENTSTSATETPSTATTAVSETPAASPAASTPAAGVSCSRNMPSEGAGEFIVSITINKEGLGGFAKLQENLPEGLTAEKMETAGATFTFVDQVVKFVWVSLPTQSEIKVSYKVTVTNGTSGDKSIDGMFSYIENDETKKTPVAAGTVTVKPKEAGTPATSETSPTAAVDKKEEPPVSTPVANVPSPQNGVNYRVQIMALHRTIDVSYFRSTYSINENVMVDLHEGWTKYTVGSFNEYKPSRDHREEIKGKGVAGPFVTAYNNGKRITVQEALMITNQKWYK